MQKKIVLFSMAFLLACQSQNDQAVKIYAAASLATALPQAGLAFETQYPHAKLDFIFSASSILAKQIEQGAKADLYISANPQWMDFLQEKKMLQPGSRFNLFANKLVCIIPEGRRAPASLEDLPGKEIQKITVGDWTHVPVGIYAKGALEKNGLWDKIENKLIPAVDARAALTYVERMQVDCGIVYRSDAIASQNVKIAFELPDSLQPEIYYPAAVIAGAQKPFLIDFISFLKSKKVARLFRNNGFSVITEGSSD